MGSVLALNEGLAIPGLRGPTRAQIAAWGGVLELKNQPAERISDLISFVRCI